MDNLMKQYENIGPSRVKIEETTVGTKTWAATSMSDYYSYWERRIFNAITTMLIRGMSSFQTLFQAITGDGKIRRPPLLKIKADFNPPDVVVGALHSVFKLITKLLQNVPQSANSFIRWMEGTRRPQSTPPVAYLASRGLLRSWGS